MTATVQSDATSQIIQVKKESHSLGPVPTDGISWLAHLLKTALKGEPSKQPLVKGRQEHPFNMDAVLSFTDVNVHHSTCINAKVAATVGLGLQTEQDFQLPDLDKFGRTKPREAEKPSKAEEVLDPLCEIAFQDVISDVCEDYWACGNGWMEAVRADEGDTITGLHHVPAGTVYVVLEDDGFNKHYEMQGEGTHTKKFARFGDLKDFIARENKTPTAAVATVMEGEASEKITELIHFRQPSNRSRHYGFPKWLSATASVELVQCMTQHTFDFFLNRGVPEFLLFFLGAMIDKDNWKDIEETMKKHIGLANSHKSSAFNLPMQDLTVQLEKLAMEDKTDGQFSKLSETLATNIVSAHRVPPLLAGIQIPGKLGANNELPNAIKAFQLLCVGQAQKQFTTILNCTLGNSEFNGSLGLKPGDFTFKKITDQIDLDQAETVSRMRQPLAEAQAQGRNPADGLRD